MSELCPHGRDPMLCPFDSCEEKYMDARHAHEIAERDAEIARLKAENERVTKQRDDIALAVHSQWRTFDEDHGRSKEDADRSLFCFGLRIINGQVEEVK